MRRILQAFAALLTIAAAALAPALARSAKAEAVAEAPKTATPAIWRVSDEDSDFYLLGTFHILPTSLDWRSREVGAAIDAAEIIWFEAEVDTQAANETTRRILIAHGFNPPGRALSDILGAEDSALLATIAAALGLPIDALDPMRPWQAFFTLGAQFIVSQGFDPGSGVETALLAEARARGRELKFLETVEQQLGFFTALPAAIEKDLLVLTLRDWEKQRADFALLFEAWRSGDIEAIDALMNAAMRDATPQVFEILLTRRNEAWAEEISKAIAGGRGTALVAVGAGHLVGESALPALLEARGFKVERLAAPATQ